MNTLSRPQEVCREPGHPDELPFKEESVSGRGVKTLLTTSQWSTGGGCCELRLFNCHEWTLPFSLFHLIFMIIDRLLLCHALSHDQRMYEQWKELLKLSVHCLINTFTHLCVYHAYNTCEWLGIVQTRNVMWKLGVTGTDLENCIWAALLACNAAMGTAGEIY